MSKIINTEKNIFIEETEVKPNKYATLILIVSLVVVLLCWILNEVRVFRVEKIYMRIVSLATVAITIIPIIAPLFKKDLFSKTYFKYFVLSSVSLMTIAITALLPFHTTLLLLLPMFVATLYRSKSIGWLGLIASLVCTFTAFLVSYLFHNWQPSFFTFLLEMSTNVKIDLSAATREVSLRGVGYIFLFLILPRLIMVISISLLMFHNIRIGAKTVESQILLNRVSERDLLTGLYNQNFYKNVSNENFNNNIDVGIMFFDVNGLKDINDKFGHEYGDLLLKRCGASVKAICDEETFGFRIGGDEFLVIIENGTKEKIEIKTKEWEKALEKINEENKVSYNGLQCKMALGSIVGDISHLQELVHKADIIMYDNKQKMKGINN